MTTTEPAPAPAPAVTKTDKRFHMAWFTSFVPPEFRSPFSGGGNPKWLNGQDHIEFVQQLERACFDFVMLEDSSMVSDIYGGTAEAALAQGGYAPKGDPLLLASALAAETSHIGVISTLSSTFYPPWLLARSVSTLDHLSRGRAGWNCVTSSENLAAQNFGMDALPPHDERYERAEEFVDVVKQLWDSWEDDAFVMDAENEVYVDHTKVNPIHFVGKYHKSRGPLNLMRPPQGNPVICQAGGSPAGKRFAASSADVLLSIPKGGKEGMKAYRDAVRLEAEKIGRDPDEIKVMFVVAPTLAETDRAAQAMRELSPEQLEAKIKHQMITWSNTMEIDFSVFDLDQPLPEDASTNGHQSTLSTFRTFAAGRTLREALAEYRTEALPLVGSPATVAEQMEEAMDYVGGDGFLIMGPTTRRYIAEITDGLVPALQRRGLMRTEYTHDHLKDNLREF